MKPSLVRSLPLAILLSVVFAGSACAQPPPGSQMRPFRPAVGAGDLLFLSGQIGTVPKDMDPQGEGFEAAARGAMDALGKVLAANGAGFDDLVKCTIMIEDMEKWGRFNQVYATYFTPDKLPARSAFGGVTLALGAPIEVECIAHLPGRGAAP